MNQTPTPDAPGLPDIQVDTKNLRAIAASQSETAKTNALINAAKEIDRLRGLAARPLPSDWVADGEPFGHAMYNSKGACVGFRQNTGFGYNFTVADFLRADKIMPHGAPHTGRLVYAAPEPLAQGAAITQAMLDAGTASMLAFRKSGDDWTGKPAHAAEAAIRGALSYSSQQTAEGRAASCLSGKYGDVLRPFVIAMDKELHANAGKGDRPGWLAMRPEIALLEIYYHLSKLQKAVKDDNGPGIQEYAADVANMSMMLLDICGGLGLIEDASPQPAAEGCTCPSGDGSLRWPCPKHPRAEIKAEAFPVEPLKVFSLGPWTWTETGHQFTGMDLDGAAFAAYRDYFNGLSAAPNPPQPSASVGERARDERFTAMLIGIISDVQDALGFTDEDKECSNGSLEIVDAINELREYAARYRWIRDRIAGKEHVAELVEYNHDAHPELRDEVDAAIESALTTAAGGGGEVGNG